MYEKKTCEFIRYEYEQDQIFIILCIRTFKCIIYYWYDVIIEVYSIFYIIFKISDLYFLKNNATSNYWIFYFRVGLMSHSCLTSLFSF